jgi:hypothetical protein
MTQHQAGDTRSSMPIGSVMAEAALQQAQTWSKAQCEFLSGVGAIWSRWLQWQREAIDAAGRSLAEMSDSRDLGNMFDIQRQWFADAARRSTSNWGELMNEAATLTWRVARVDQTGEQAPNAPPPREHHREQSVNREAAQ